MTDETQRQRLSELSYLWTSGDWELHSSHQSSARVVFEFEDDRPNAKELLAVRALLPRFRDSSMTLLKEEVGSAPEYLAGDFGGIEAHQLDNAAQARGLKTRVESTSETRYLAVNKEGHALLIEDDELARLAHDEMKSRGVPIVSMTEAD